MEHKKNKYCTMTLGQLFEDKSIKAKAKMKHIGEWLLNGDLPLDELMAFAEKQRAVDKGTCIEAIELSTREKPELADEALLSFVTENLKEDEPKIKWESARVIGNIAGHFPDQLETPINNLLKNAEHPGTVVRWASAYALAEILKLKKPYNVSLLPKLELLYQKEEDNGVKKKYEAGIKKARK